MKALTKGLYDLLTRPEPWPPNTIGFYNAKPAVFTARPVPQNAPFPFVVIEPSLRDDRFDTKTTRGREIELELIVVDKRTGTIAKVEEIGDHLRDLLDRYPLTVEGHRVIVMEATGPSGGPQDEDIYTRVVGLRVVIEEA